MVHETFPSATSPLTPKNLISRNNDLDEQQHNVTHKPSEETFELDIPPPFSLATFCVFLCATCTFEFNFLAYTVSGISNGLDWTGQRWGMGCGYAAFFPLGFLR
jgi:hypothetical protein